METKVQGVIDQHKQDLFTAAHYRVSLSDLSIWRFLIRYIDQEGYPPNYREIAAACSLSITAVTRGLHHLQWSGYIYRPDPHYARAIRLLKRPE